VRVRLPEDRSIGSLSPLELFDIYLSSSHIAQEEGVDLRKLAQDIFGDLRPQL
jgi:hypothetical protein